MTWNELSEYMIIRNDMIWGDSKVECVIGMTFGKRENPENPTFPTAIALLRNRDLNSGTQ